MLNLFKKKDDEGNLPVVQVLGYQAQMVRILSGNRLPMNQAVQLNLMLPGNKVIRANLVVLTQEAQQAKGAVYVAELEGPPELGEYIDAQLKGAAQPAPVNNDRRRQGRVPHTIQVVSKELPNFVAMSADISETGLRLVVSQPMEAGRSLIVAFDVDDTSSVPIRIEAQTVWCRENPDGTYWVGVRFCRLPPGQEKAMEVLTRAVQQMRVKPGSKAFSIEP
ncbi:MAG: PilZ domain-containing protein [Candidatus Eremiobacterota bacterium]